MERFGRDILHMQCQSDGFTKPGIMANDEDRRKPGRIAIRFRVTDLCGSQGVRTHMIFSGEGQKMFAVTDCPFSYKVLLA